MQMDSEGRLQNYDILHFAVHGFLHDASPDLNALVFSLPEAVEERRGAELNSYLAAGGPSIKEPYLRLREIRALNLRARLVTLSACQTSLGYSSGGEGMIALPQAFLTAGAQNVLSSNWAVNDEATREFMGGIYTRILAGGLSPEEALHEAQIELRSKYEDPYYWAAFSIYGD